MKLHETKAMTLAETLGAMVVLVLGGLAIMSSYQSSLHLTEVAHQNALAMDDLKDMMERVQTTSFTQLNANFPDGAINGIIGLGPDQYSGIVGGYGLNTEQIVVRHVPSIVADPRELVIEVSWTNHGRLYRKSLATFRSSRSG